MTGFLAPQSAECPTAPTVVLSDTSEGADAHGATLTKHQRYLWVADRGRNFLWVIDTQTDEVVNEIPLAGPVSDDPTPDLLVTSPNGEHVFTSPRPEPALSRPACQHRQHAWDWCNQGPQGGETGPSRPSRQ